MELDKNFTAELSSYRVLIRPDWKERLAQYVSVLSSPPLMAIAGILLGAPFRQAQLGLGHLFLSSSPSCRLYPTCFGCCTGVKSPTSTLMLEVSGRVLSWWSSLTRSLCGWFFTWVVRRLSSWESARRG